MSLLYILGVYAVLLLVVRLFEHRMIFFPDYPGRLQGDWHPFALAPEDVWLTASDGTKLHAWWIPHPDAKFTFLAFHGNASNIANRAPTYEFLRDIPANVFALEYRGYGRSEGKASEAGLYLDADAAYDYLVREKRVDPKSIISFGQSLGTAIAARLAAHRAVGGLVLEAPFPSATRVARKFYWFLPGLTLLVRGQLDTLANLKKVNEPVLVVHCTQDPVLPFQFGHEVYTAAGAPKQFLQIEGVCHEEASQVAPAQYRSALQNFLAIVTGKSTPETGLAPIRWDLHAEFVRSFSLTELWITLLATRGVQMPTGNESLKDRLSRYRELQITVIGRKSGRKISIPIWFVLESDNLYLLPVQGSDTHWYKNVLSNPSIAIEARGAKGEFQAAPITDAKQVSSVVEKFRAKYGAGDVKKYYSNFDVAVSVPMR